MKIAPLIVLAYNAIEHLDGIQSQVPNSAYFAIWTRLMNFRKEELTNLIVDGFVKGIWKIVRQSNTATLNIELFESISKEDYEALLLEGQDLMRFAADDIAEHNIEVIFKK